MTEDREQTVIEQQQPFHKLCQLCSQNYSRQDVLATEIDWPTVWKLALRHRVVPVMADRIKQLQIPVPEKFDKLISRHVQQNLYKGLKQAAELVRLTQLFEEYSIPFVVFKGIALLKLMGLELHQRHHGDIDILLANVDDIKKADAALHSIGYERLTLSRDFSLNKYQQQHFRLYEKDVIYHHPQKAIQLELHFKLCLSNELLPIPPSEFYQNRAKVVVNSTKIPVMSKVDHQVYLLIHGAVSRWFRLKWLCDVPLVSNNGAAYFSDHVSQATEKLNIERMMTLGLSMAYKLLAMPIPSSVVQHEKSRRYMQHAIGIVQKNMKQNTSSDMDLAEKIKFWVIFYLVYMPLLKRGCRYKVDHFKSYLTRISDWEIFPLPESLFFLYYPLRPFLWLKRQL